MESILKRATNNALEQNPSDLVYPRTSDINITVHGSDWYWAVTAVMGVSTLIFAGLAFRVPRSKRIFHYITAAITMTACISYFTMGSNLGYAAIPVEFVRSNPKVSGFAREVFYVRYIDWVITTPLLLMDIMLTAGLPWPTILYTLFLDEIMIVTGLVGALVESRYKWGYFTFAMAALFYIAYNICWVGRKHANHLGAAIGKTYLMVGAWTIFLWFIYPIAWGLSEGGNVISPDSEAVFYGILDILAKPVFGALLLWGHRNIDPAVLGLHIRDYDDTMHPSEKNFGSAAAAHNTAGTGGVTGAHDGVTGTHNGGLTGTHNGGVTGAHNGGVTGAHNGGVTGTHNGGVTGAHNGIHEPPVTSAV